MNTILSGRQVHIPWTRIWWLVLTICLINFLWTDLLQIGSSTLTILAKRLHSPAAALSLVRSAQWLTPSDANLYRISGDMLLLEGREEGAHQQYHHAIRLDDRDGSAYNNLAVLEASRGNQELALDLAIGATKGAPNKAVAFYNRGLIEWGQSKIPLARRSFVEATRLQPDWAEPHLFLSAAYLAEQKFEEAEASAKKALQVGADPQTTNALVINFLLLQGRHQEVVAIADTILDADPHAHTFAYYKARAMAALGQGDAALALLFPLYDTVVDPALRELVATEIVLLRRAS